MYRSDDLVGFLRLLVSHLSVVIDEGERLSWFYSDVTRQALLLQAIESGETDLIEQQESLCRDYEALFVLQMSHAREWVDRLGRLDGDIERDADEFLAATFGIERLLAGRARRKIDYRIENSLVGTGCAGVLREDLRASIEVGNMLVAIFELLARLEERYDLIEELLDDRVRPLRVPFAAYSEDDAPSKIVHLFDTADRGPVAGDSPVSPQ